MRVTVVGINYAPELTGIAPYNRALGEFLTRKGHEVEMVTTFPYYPAWRKRTEDRGKLFDSEINAGVTVHRCWHFVPQKASTWRRMVHEASFVLSATFRMALLPRPDIVIVISPPLLLGMVAWLICKLKRTRFVFHIQDLQPDAALSLGMVRKGIFSTVLYAMEAFAYRHATAVSGISPGMVEALVKKGVPNGKLIYFPNGVQIPATEQRMQSGAFRKKHGIEATEFMVLYSGNLGVKQGLEIIVEAAKIISEAAGIRIVMSGDGAQRDRLAQMVENSSAKNILLLPIQPPLEYEAMVSDADVCLITQQAGAGGFFFPSKLLSATAFGKPVINVADPSSDLAKANEHFKFGITVSPGHPELLADSILSLSRDREGLEPMKVAAFEFAKQFELDAVLGEFERRIRALIREEPGCGTASKQTSAA